MNVVLRHDLYSECKFVTLTIHYNTKVDTSFWFKASHYTQIGRISQTQERVF